MAAPPRIKKGPAPQRKLTANTYRKAKPFLRFDFHNRCAYCLTDLSSTKVRSRCVEVEHFDSHLPAHKVNRYGNLMLSCRACNGNKQGDPVCMEEEPSVQLLDCTKVDEFKDYIGQNPDGTWYAKEDNLSAKYHLEVFDLADDEALVHERTSIASRVRSIINLVNGEIRGLEPLMVEELMSLIRGTAKEFNNSLMVTDDGAVSVREYLIAHGVKLDNLPPPLSLKRPDHKTWRRNRQRLRSALAGKD